jgi:hypothetical protein
MFIFKFHINEQHLNRIKHTHKDKVKDFNPEVN